MAGQKWAETRALFQRAGAYANRVKNDTILPQAMREEMQALMQLIESKQFMAHANSILEAEGNGKCFMKMDKQIKSFTHFVNYIYLPTIWLKLEKINNVSRNYVNGFQ